MIFFLKNNGILNQNVPFPTPGAPKTMTFFVKSEETSLVAKTESITVVLIIFLLRGGLNRFCVRLFHRPRLTNSHEDKKKRYKNNLALLKNCQPKLGKNTVTNWLPLGHLREEADGLTPQVSLRPRICHPFRITTLLPKICQMDQSHCFFIVTAIIAHHHHQKTENQ